MLYLDALVLLFCYKSLSELTSKCCCTDVNLPLLLFGELRGLNLDSQVGEQQKWLHSP